jgi:hypothetical protein
MPSREDLMLNWLKNVMSEQPFTITPASSDASFRRYFRVASGNKTWVVMDAPPDKEEIKPFINIARFLKKHHVNTPEIYAENHTDGFLLLQDFGHTAYLSELNDSSADELYKSAIDSILAMQNAPINNALLPEYDVQLLQKELNLFPEWFLGKHLSINAPAFLAEIDEVLINNAIEQPQVIVHRDYHSRNLMLLTQQQPGVIDFQDAVIGACSYDLVSLLRDCYIEWPEEKIDQWLHYYLDVASLDIPFPQFKKWFDLMGLQRHLKVLGIFCRLYYRDGKANYLNDLPLTLKYVLSISKRYEEFSALYDFLNQAKIKAIL